jgi:plasmid stabilization system protein ParE
LRPPFAQERLRRRPDGRIALELKMAWRDGTRELVFAPWPYIAVYEIIQNEVQVLRIRHASQDWP